MYLSRTSLLLFLTVLLGTLTLSSAQLNNITTPSLNVTAVTASNGASVFECWQFPGFASTTVAGVVGSLNLVLGNTTQVIYTVIPPRFDGGLHNAPVAQFVYIASGLAQITLPNMTETAKTSVWVQGGKYGLIIATDTADVSKYGHISTYPSDADCVVLQMPFVDGVIPFHTVLHDGACGWEDMVGI